MLRKISCTPNYTLKHEPNADVESNDSASADVTKSTVLVPHLRQPQSKTEISLDVESNDSTSAGVTKSTVVASHLRRPQAKTGIRDVESNDSASSVADEISESLEVAEAEYQDVSNPRNTFPGMHADSNIF